MSERRIGLNKKNFLFSCTASANEVAQMLRGSWDGCNGVFLEQPDKVAIETATKLLQVEYCCQGEHCWLPELKQTFIVLEKTRSGKSVLAINYILQAQEGEFPIIPISIFSKTKAHSDHMGTSELDQHLHNHCLNINLLRNRTQEQ